MEIVKPKSIYEEKETEWLLQVLKDNGNTIKYHQKLILEIEETIAIIKDNNEQIKKELESRGTR